MTLTDAERELAAAAEEYRRLATTPGLAATTPEQFEKARARLTAAQLAARDVPPAGRLTDAERERIIDRRVQQRLATDRAYRNAESSEQQSAREEQITAEEEQRLYRGHGA